VLQVLLFHVFLSVPEEGLAIKAETCSTAYKHFPNRALMDALITHSYISRITNKRLFVVYLMTPSVNQNIRMRGDMKADSE
jgi:hypothetical protein